MYERHPHARSLRRARPLRVLAAVIGIFFVGVGALDILYRMSGFSGLVAAESAASSALLSRPQNRADTAPFTPTRLSIPSLTIDAAIEAVGRNPNGDMTAPSSYSTTAWYRDGSRPGEPGTTVIAGHFNNSLGLAGVFERLNQIELGDTIVVHGESGEARYVVRELSVHDASNAPLEQLFATTGASRLVLITCDGAWDRGTRTYDKRLIVVAEML